MDDRELFARLIQCEAGGEGDNGMRAVASVVMNRVNAPGGEYKRVGQGSIRKILYQTGQFVCMSETERGKYNPQNIYNMRPEQIHYFKIKHIFSSVAKTSDKYYYLPLATVQFLIRK